MARRAFGEGAGPSVSFGNTVDAGRIECATTELAERAAQPYACLVGVKR
jgi:hypothetical protein